MSAKYRQRPPQAVSTAAPVDNEYDYTDQTPTPTPTSASAKGIAENRSYNKGSSREPPAIDSKQSEDALLDLAQLEELHQEAEKMKALGNKHMASQEYARAYNAYSAALQLCPVGPSSHVFLSNRAAALLSLKRYQAAATDAKRAIALAPTFGKAHARLGQALYFLKDYPKAIEAYQDAASFEPDNPITKAYLEKAKSKYEKQLRKNRGEEISVAGDSTAFTMHNSVTTSDHQNVVMSGFRGVTNSAVLKAAAKSPSQVQVINEEDPDFDEALRIQQRANSYLAKKKYKAAIEEYTAALFLVPDDPVLSPELHLGRAHALNGSRRHDSARNDAQMAIRLNPHPAAYSTLAKSLFYMKDYSGSVKAFEDCISMLPEGESLGMFDKAYLQKAEAALEEEEYSLKEAGTPSKSGASVASVPKLPPPRFVPREEAIQSTPKVPAMPKQWPQQLQSPTPVLRCGPERNVLFLSESLGIKLNRGSDGIVRVLAVTVNSPKSPVARKGKVEAGDVVREAAGVDIRRPITNLMWGDTVALIKMAPRPITFVVAKELSAVPPTVLEEMRASMNAAASSRSSGDEAVSIEVDMTEVSSEPEAQNAIHSIPSITSGPADEETETQKATVSPSSEDMGKEDPDTTSCELTNMEAQSECQRKGDASTTLLQSQSHEASEGGSLIHPSRSKDSSDAGSSIPASLADMELSLICTEFETAQGSSRPASPNANSDCAGVTETGELCELGERVGPTETPPPVELSLRDQEEQIIGGEVLFDPERDSSGGWDNLRWMSHAGIRKVRLCQAVYRLYEQSEKKGVFWMSSTSVKSYAKRAVIIYDEPQLMLIVRRVSDNGELRRLLGLPDIVDLDDAIKERYWTVESVADPLASRLRLSKLTTPTSSTNGSDREASCFEILTPTESIRLSAVRVREGVKNGEQSFTDSGAFLETTAVETAIKKALCTANARANDIGHLESDIAWMHQLVLGTLHSVVLSGSHQSVVDALNRVRASLRGSDAIPDSTRLPQRFVDPLDENGRTPLYYACVSGMHETVAALIEAGANVQVTATRGMGLSHVCALNLDHKSLSTILSATYPAHPDPNELDEMGRTPMYIAAVKGQTKNSEDNAIALNLCIKALEAWGGQFLVGNTTQMPNHVSSIAAEWRASELKVLLDYHQCRFPLQDLAEPDQEQVSCSLGALFHYPLHAALIALRWQLKTMTGPTLSSGGGVQHTIKCLIDHGFEPNERLEYCETRMQMSRELALFTGYTPLQVLASIALELETVEAELSDDVYLAMRALMAEVATTLVENGARTALDAPMDRRPRGKASSRKLSCDSDLSVDSHRSSLKLETNKTAMEFLGGSERLARAKKSFAGLSTVAATQFLRSTLEQADSMTLEDSNEPGGNHEKSCAICWSVFGSVMKRKHKCRVTHRYLCDDCSSKRVLFEGKEYRLSDGQFALARVDAAVMALKQEYDIMEQDRISSAHIRNSTSKTPAKFREEPPMVSSVDETSKAPTARRTLKQIRLDRMAAEEEADRSSLFGGMLNSASKMFSGAEDQQDRATQQSNQVQGLAATMGQTRNALLERGEKLNDLNDKSAQLVDQSAEFARLAKELRKKSESTNWFGF